MKINSVGAMSYNNTARSVRPMSENFGASPSLYKAGKTMKALMLAGMMGMAAVAMSCKQPTDPTPWEEPAPENPTNPDDPTDVDDPTEVNPTDPTDVDDPTNPTNPTDPTDVDDPTEVNPTDPTDVDDPTEVNPTDPTDVDDPTEVNPTNPTIDIENSPIVQGIRDLGFKVSCVDVAPVEGLYTPETGDLVDLKFLHNGGGRIYTVHMQLDRENSTKDNLVYKGTYIDEKRNKEYNIEDKIGKMKFDKENHAIQYYDDEGPLMNMRIKLNEDNKPEFIYNGLETDYNDISMEVVEDVVFKPPGLPLFQGFDVQLAK